VPRALADPRERARRGYRAAQLRAEGRVADQQFRASDSSRDGARDCGERMLNTAHVVKFFYTRAC